MKHYNSITCYSTLILWIHTDVLLVQRPNSNAGVTRINVHTSTKFNIRSDHLSVDYIKHVHPYFYPISSFRPAFSILFAMCVSTLDGKTFSGHFQSKLRCYCVARSSLRCINGFNLFFLLPCSRCIITNSPSFVGSFYQYYYCYYSNSFYFIFTAKWVRKTSEEFIIPLNFYKRKII